MDSDKLKTEPEEDLGLSVLDGTWTSVLELVNSISFSGHRCLIQFKVVHRAHISQPKLSTVEKKLLLFRYSGPAQALLNIGGKSLTCFLNC